MVNDLGWGLAWAGAQALRNKALDVDLLMIVAAIGVVAIGEIFDGARLIVIFGTGWWCGRMPLSATMTMDRAAASTVRSGPRYRELVREHDAGSGRYLNRGNT